MKNFLLSLIMILPFGCKTAEKKIYAEMGYAILAEMKPIWRDGKEWGCELTWKDVGRYNLTIVTHAFPPDYCDNYIIGVRYRILIHK